MPATPLEKLYCIAKRLDTSTVTSGTFLSWMRKRLIPYIEDDDFSLTADQRTHLLGVVNARLTASRAAAAEIPANYQDFVPTEEELEEVRGGV